MIHPENVSPVEELPYLHGLLSIYSLTRGLTMSMYRKLISQSLNKLIDLPEWINESILKKNGWKKWKDTVELLHRPKNLKENEIEKLRERLAFDEALSHYIKLLI